MFQNLSLFRISSAMASHSTRQHSLTARNIANADTPGYAAKSLPRFEEAFRTTSRLSTRTTRPEHLTAGGLSPNLRVRETNSQFSPNGNSVSIEEEMVQAAYAQKDQSKAIAIYRHGLTLLRTTMGGRS